MHFFRTISIAVLFTAATNIAHAADPTVPVLLEGHSSSVATVAWSIDGKSIATAGEDLTVRIWDSVTGKQASILSDVTYESYGRPVVAFTPDLTKMAVNHRGNITIRKLNDDNDQVTFDAILDRGQTSAFRQDVFAMAFSPNGKQLATAGSVASVGGRHGLPGGIVTIWDAETGKLVHKSERLSTAAGSLAWNMNGKQLAAGTNGAGGELPEAGEVAVWSTETGNRLQSFRVQPEVKPGEWASAGDVAFSPDGKQVAVPVTAESRSKPAGLLVNATGASVRVWELETGNATQPIRRLNESVTRVVYGLDGKQLATAGSDNVLRVWDLATGKELATFPHPNKIESVAFSPNSNFLAAGCKDGSVRIWRMPVDL